MKLFLVWYSSLFAAFHPARGEGDGANTTKLDDLGRSGRPDRHTRLRRKHRLASTLQDDKKVVIVGAGFAGWGAAHRLVEGGMRAEDITLLEADVGFGGRAQKDKKFMPFPLDLGPSYVPDGFRSELAALAGVSVKDLPLSVVEGVGSYLWNDAMTYNDFLAKHIIAQLDVCESETACEEQAGKMGYKFKGELSNKKAYGCYAKSKKNNPNKYEAFWGGYKAKKMTIPLDDDKKRINCDRINKIYNCEVTSVDYEDANQVFTTCEDGRSFTSTQAIVTVPLSVLKDGDITFKPDLPTGIQYNVDNRDWWGGFKFFFEFDMDFQPDGSFSIGGERDYESGVLTGEHLAWDYTRYCAPNFEGGRNLVGGYFLGTKADDFENMNEAQMVQKVLSKFKEYYSDENGFTQGYRPDSYQQHLIVNWEENPFVRGSYSGPDPKGFEGHRADNRNKIFIAGEAFPAPLFEFCSSPKDCYYSYYWADLPVEIQEAYKVIGWTQQSWDPGSPWPDAYDLYWNKLDNAQKEAMSFIGHTQESWDRRLVCDSTPQQCWYAYSWDNLPQPIQDAYAVLGYNKNKWNNGNNSSIYLTPWFELTIEHQEAATSLGYTQEIWDKRLGVFVMSDQEVEYEENGWVYSALHSGQKAAEMILALQSWSDLIPKEDFGTYDRTLGVFQGCSGKTQAIKKKAKFFLELKANKEVSCAKTKFLALSGQATEIRIAFKLKATKFEDGDLFSVEIATNGDSTYQQILNFGKESSGKGGILGYAQIPKMKKWISIKDLLHEQEWLVVKLENLGTNSVSRISLQFAHHTASKKKQKVHLDNISLQEFVPM